MSFTSIIGLAAASLWNRRGSAFLTLLAVTFSVMLFLGVEKLRQSAQESFENTISGTNLIVGARTSPVNLVLFSVFNIGTPSANMTWETFEAIEERADVAWAVPIALGDSHRGYRVVGTNQSFFERYKYRSGSALSFAEGASFDDLYDVVVGAEIASRLNYNVGDQITLSHGLGEVSFLQHDDRPFTITGIMERTGTPVDQSLYVSLEAIEAIHVGWESGAPSPMARMFSADDVRQMDLTPSSITAAYIGLENPRTLLTTQRSLNTYRREALLAAIPSQAIAQVWSLIAVAERALLAVSAFVILVGLVSILTSILTSLRERRREMAVLRAIGAGPPHILFLLVSEAVLLAGLGALLGILLVPLIISTLGPYLEAQFGLGLSPTLPGLRDLQVFAAVTGAAFLMGLIPGVQALKSSLADGLSIKL